MLDAFYQIQNSFESPFDIRLLLNGLFLIGLSIVSITASYSFNYATAESNTDLIINAVILLFINDLDEQTMKVLEKFVPAWNDQRVDEIKEYMMMRSEQTTKSQHEEGNRDTDSSSTTEELPGRQTSKEMTNSSFFESSHSFDNSNEEEEDITFYTLEDSKRQKSFGMVALDGSVETKWKGNYR